MFGISGHPRPDGADLYYRNENAHAPERPPGPIFLGGIVTLPPATRRRVVQVIAPAPFGGAETVVRQLLNELRARNVPTTTFALGVSAPETHAWVRQLFDADFDVRCPRPSRTGEFRDLRRELRRPDVVAVHSHGYRADFAAFLGRPPGMRWVATSHGFTGGGGRMRVYESLDQVLLRKADFVLAVSSRLFALLRNGDADSDRVRLVRNVPPETARMRRDEARALLQIPPNATAVAWIGRLSHEKGADRLPRLFADRATSCSLVLFGDGPLREALSTSLSRLEHLTTHWLGVRHDAARLLAGFDLLVLPSRTEGMPMAVLEAMSAGIPAVAFDVGDVRYAVTEQSGWCVPADDVDAFAAALAQAIGSPLERESRGRAAAAYLTDQFSIHSWVQAHLDAYGLPG